MDTRPLEASFHTGPQIKIGEIAEAAGLGYRALISNRPDHEELGQPTAEEIAEVASAAGLAFVHIPVRGGAIGDDDVAAMRRALTELPGPILGFCRSAMRTTVLWALARAGDLSPDQIISTAREAGYDLEMVRPRLTPAG